MKNRMRSKQVSKNAAVLAIAGLVSFVLPKIADSVTDGPADFLVAMSQVFPILVAIPISCRLIGNSHADTDV
ncbi:MAG: hypothetical protein AB8B50_16210 [Pirellulaceae bacterium]